MNSKADIPEALETLKERPLYAEKWAYFKMVRELLTQIGPLTLVADGFASIGAGRHGHQNKR